MEHLFSVLFCTDKEKEFTIPHPHVASTCYRFKLDEKTKHVNELETWLFDISITQLVTWNHDVTITFSPVISFSCSDGKEQICEHNKGCVFETDATTYWCCKAHSSRLNDQLQVIIRTHCSDTTLQKDVEIDEYGTLMF